MRQRLLLLLLLVASLALAACGTGGEAATTTTPTTTAATTGATTPSEVETARAQLYLPAGEARATVILLHGWNDLDPAAYGPWIDHLLSQGVAVVFPDYQEGFLSSPASMLDGTEAGIRDGLAAAAAQGATGPVVAAGYSLGGGFSVVYAAQARAWGLPEPAAVYAVFPAEPLGLPATLPPVPDATTVEMVVGDRDAVVGRAGADALAARIAPHPAEIRVLESTDAVVYDHFAPKRDDARAARDFWAPLDRIVDRVAPPR